jgi:outer membrane lipoprotein
MRLLIIAAVILAVSACTTVPEQIQGDFPDIAPARVEPGVIGSNVRWGGVILKSQNRGDRTCFEILSRELDKYLRPMKEDLTTGRYIACKAGFQDPLVFQKGREVTTTGTIRNIRVKKVDDFSYRYPVLDVDILVLWEKRRHVVVYRGYGSPWHYGYPYGGWGYPYRGGWGYPYGGGWGRAEQRTLLPDPSIVDESGPSLFDDEPQDDPQ